MATLATTRIRIAFVLGSIGAAAAACSLVNSFDDLAPEVLPDAATSSDGAITNVDSGPNVDSPDADLDGGDAAPPSEALLVAGGLLLAEPDAGKDASAATDQPVLLALDPATGHEIPSARETLNVEAIVYDGAPDRSGQNRDLWFIFENKGAGFIYPLPDDKVVLHIRQFDRAAKKWAELSTLEVPPLVSTLQTTLVSERVVFVAYKGGSATTYELVSVDASNPSAPVISAKADLPSLPIALLGARSATGAGGRIGAALRVGGGPTSKLTLATYLVSASAIASGAAVDGGTIGTGSPALAAYVAPPGTDFANTEFLVATRQDALDAGALERFSPDQPLGSVTTFPLKPGANQLKPLAIAPCDNAAFAIETNTDLAVHLAKIRGNGSYVDVGHQTGHSGQSVTYEPYTRTVIAPFSQGSNFALTAIKMSNVDGGYAMAARSNWNPPANVRISLLTPRVPLPYVCTP